MRVYGNIMNRIEETIRPAVPEIGMGATILMWSDRIACTIVEVNAKKTRIVIQHDNAIRTDKNGMSESQEYCYEPNADGVKIVATLRKNGTFVEQGESMKNGTIVRIGERRHYHDYSF